MRFGPAQAISFGTENGAYSQLTPRELYDSQITLDAMETEVLLSHFGVDSMHVGNVRSGPTNAAKSFRRFPNGEKIQLNVVFPKPEKPELRLYLSTGAGFMPKALDIWFLYVLNAEMWIGSLSERTWRERSSGKRVDETDGYFQEAILEHDPARVAALAARDVFTRNRATALESIACEFEPSHGLFRTRTTLRPYVEAHHLVPISMQRELGRSVDIVENVFALCPHCHRAVHYAEEATARAIVERLSDKRPVLTKFSLTLPDLLSVYAIEIID